jgi:DNA repair exonuclease SbcCD nuclease subunit
MQPVEELLIFSDLHAHNFKYGSKRVTYEGVTLNSRLIDTLNVLDEIKNYAIRNGIRTLLFGGDLFHRRQSYNTEVFNFVFDKFQELSNFGLDILMIPGNHDYADRSGLVHALRPFEAIENVWVGSAKTINSISTGHCEVLCVPFTPDLDEAKHRLALSGKVAEEIQRPTILLAHLGMQGARVGSDYILVTDQDVKVADVPHQSFTACFFGHYHEHQQLFANGWYIGATHEQNWGDTGGKRGFLHVRVYKDKVDFKHIETSAPKFVTIDGDELEYQDKDFVRVYVDTASLAAVRRVQKQYGRDDLEVVPRLDKSEIVLTLEASQLDPEAAMSAWLEANPPEELDKQILLDEGRAILREVRGGNL